MVGARKMSIWLLIWLMLSTILLFFSWWTVAILIKQKKAWEIFAKRHQLRFTRGRFFESPKINGVYKNHTISLFTGEHRQEDARKNRKLTAIEIELKSVMPMSGVVASGGMIPLLDGLDQNMELTPKSKEWKSEYVIRTDNLAMMNGYISDDRLHALSTIMKVVNAWVIFIFRENNTLLRLDMPNPLENSNKMDILLNKLIDVAGILELKTGESKRLETLRHQHLESGDEMLVLEEEGKSPLVLELEEEEDKTDLEPPRIESEIESEEKS